LSLCTVGARIPMVGETGSLNVSVAAALLLFEAVRQRM
jgi:tRNA G18 (ribose-2'-O)-methylase SpoU